VEERRRKKAKFHRGIKGWKLGKYAAA